MQAVDSDYRALTESCGLLDLSERGRLCLLGADREKFLHGQVTNDVLNLRVGQGCYAALVNAKARFESDLFIFKLQEELLLDFEPGLTSRISDRLQRFIIADDVQVVDVSEVYGLLSLHGPQSSGIVGKVVAAAAPSENLHWIKTVQPEGDLYLARNDRFGILGFDLFAPKEAIPGLVQECEKHGARRVSEKAAEVCRVENGIPRFGIDMDETNLAPEAGIQRRAISYAKGCYIGQEIIARIRTYGQVARALRLLRLADVAELPAARFRLFHEGKEIGYITSAVFSPKYNAPVALAYVRKEVNAVGNSLTLENGKTAEIIAAPES